MQVLGAGGSGVLSGVVAISAGVSDTLALKADGTVWAWGYNGNGELGNNSTTESHIPVQVLGAGGSGVLSGVVAISAGVSDTLALKADGTVWAWGYNGNGELGNNSTTESHIPVQVLGAGGSGALSGVVAIATGVQHTVALKSDGTVWEWGFNGNGELGNNSTSGSLTPVQVLGAGGTGVLSGVVTISAGVSDTLALKADGTVWAWGHNDAGQLGNNSTIDSHIPVPVLGAGGSGVLNGVVAIAAGDWYAVALKSDGTEWAWGYNAYGQLGINSTTWSNTPMQVLGAGGSGVLSGIVAIAADNGESVALKSDGTVWAWGYNGFGQFGINSAGIEANTPVESLISSASWLLAPSGLTATASTSALSNSLSWTASAGASTYNIYGSTFADVSPLNGTLLGTVSGTTFNHTGLNSGSRYYYVVAAVGGATETTGSSPASAVAAIAAPTLTLTQTGGGSATLSWNSISGASSYNLYYSTTSGVTITNGTKISGVTSPYTLTGLRNGQAVYCIVTALAGASESASAQVAATPNIVVAIASGEEGRYTASLMADGTVWTWGDNSYGELGNNTTTDNHVPLHVLGADGVGLLSGVSAIAPGGGHMVALKSDGTVWTWGYNGYGQLGNNSTADIHIPVQVQGPGGAGMLTGVVAIASGYQHTAALKADGTVWEWGRNIEGELGNHANTNSSTPVQVQGPGGTGVLAGVIAISAGEQHTVALKADGTVWSWGASWYGQLGNNSKTGSNTPVQVLGIGASGVLSGVVAISAGMQQTVALKADGTVVAWGCNQFGQLGNNSTTESHVPVQVLGAGGAGLLSGVVEISSGYQHTVALKADGSVWAWGWNGQGQLGTNSTTDSHTPVQVLGVGGTGVLGNVIGISAGSNHVAALEADGSVVEWGYNSNGQLGNNSASQSGAPVSSLISSPSWLFAPAGLTATASNSSLAIALSWTAAAGATAYNVYESTSPNVSPLNGTLLGQISGTTYTHNNNISYGTRYYYVVTAVGGATESAPTFVADAFVSLAAPSLSASTGGGTASVGWDLVPGATSYNLYFSTVSGVTVANGTRVSGVTSTYTLTGLTNGQPLYLIVTAAAGASETPSAQVVLTPNTVVAIAEGSAPYNTISLMADGTVQAWGDNEYGQLGNNSLTASYEAVQVQGPGGAGVLSGVVAIAAGQPHTVALKSNGTVWTWGANAQGELGNNSTVASLTPVQVVGAGGAGFLSGISEISAGADHVIALKSDGTVWNWGYNWGGSLGNNSTTQSNAPVQVLGAGGAGTLTGVVSVAAGFDDSVALKGDGTVWTWGYNNYGELGNNTTTTSKTPVQVVGAGGSGVLGGIVTISAGAYHTAALKSDGTVWAWGFNGNGQLGNNTTTNRAFPAQVLGAGGTGVLSGVVAISAGVHHTVALKADGTLWAWGYNAFGELGNNTTGSSSTPVQVLGAGGSGTFAGAIAVSAANDHTVALKSDGTVWAWGDNGYGELGNGTNSNSAVPVASVIPSTFSAPPYDPGWLPAPLGLTATPSATLPTISLSWTASSGATAYNIYRSTFSDVSPLTGTFLTQVSGNSYNNTGLSDGVLYYYSVTAVGGNTESAGSFVAEAVAK